MLEPSGCWAPPPKPPRKLSASKRAKEDDRAMAIRPKPTQTFPRIRSQNSPVVSARIPEGIWRTAVAPVNTDFSSPTSVKERFRSSLMKGSRGTIRATNRSFQTCMAEPKARTRRDWGALVTKFSIASDCGRKLFVDWSSRSSTKDMTLRDGPTYKSAY